MKISVIEILSPDLEATKDLYHHKLQWPVAEENQNHIRFSLLESDIIFHLDHSSKPVYHIAFNIPCNQINDALKWMDDKVNLIPVQNDELIADFSNWNAEAFYFFDNQHNILEFIARRDLHNESINEFGPGSILSVSEAGIVTSDVKQTCQSIIEDHDLQFFSKQPPTANFAALGDDEGLFIVVSNNRPWYPTKILSSKFWMKIHFHHQGKSHIYETLTKKF